MTVQFKPNEPVRKGIKRVVRRQIDKALCELTGSGPDKDKAIHDARKRFKKVRAALRLVRDEVGDRVYRRENTRFRDAARPLSAVRDAKALVEALDGLTKHYADQVTPEAFAAVREALEARRRTIRKCVLEEEKALAAVTAIARSGRRRVRRWRIRHKGWAAIRGGLKRVYKGGHRALAAAGAEPGVADLHEWRKQAKYLWHQLQLLEPVRPQVMGELVNQAHDLAQLLGDDHDLAVLRQTVTANPDTYGGDNTLQTLLALIDRRREELQRAAIQLGKWLYRDKPAAFTAQVKGYWKAWRAESKSERQPVSSN